MKILLKNLFFILLIAVVSSAGATERDGFSEYIPEPQFMWPDTNFTFLSHGFPTSPLTQVMANGHLYVAFSAYLNIYEIQSDGTLFETCSKMMPYVIGSMDHDGDYLYLSGINGLEIYEGTDFIDPSLIGTNPMRYLQVLGNISVHGDSLYYWWDDSSWGSTALGIMNIQDRTSPIVVYESEIGEYTVSHPPAKYDRYLVTTRRRPYYIIAILDLEDPSGTPSIVDSLNIGGFCIKVFENRLYIGKRSELRIYEFSNGPHPELRSVLPVSGAVRDIDELLIDGVRYGFTCSWDGLLLKINLDDLSNPAIVDSIMFPEEMGHDFMEIEQFGEFSYAMTTMLRYYVEHPGVHVIDWASNNDPYLLESVQEYSLCNSVVPHGNALYAGLDFQKFIVLDITDKQNPLVMEELNDVITGWNPKLFDDYLCTLVHNTVQFYNIRDPFNPTLEWSYNFPLPENYYINDFIVYDSLLIANYCVFNLGGPGGLVISNIADRSNPELLFEDLVEWRVKPLHLDYPILYFPENYHWSVIVFDISNPSEPEQVNRIYSDNSSIQEVYTYEDYLYLSGGIDKLYRRNGNGFALLGEYYLNARFCEYVNGKLFYYGDRGLEFVSGLQVWDITADPINPVYAGFLNHESGLHYHNFAIDWPYVYMPGRLHGVVISEYSDLTEIEEEIIQVPSRNTILSSYPNPFNQNAVIRYAMAEPGDVNLSIYNLLGQQVSTLVVGVREAGEYSITWDASNFPSGVYFARLEMMSNSQTIKMVLLK